MDDIEAAQTTVAEAGGTISKPAVAFPGGRRFHFLDPSGLELAIMQPIAGDAYAEREERQKGMTAVGMAADLAMLSQDR